MSAIEPSPTHPLNRELQFILPADELCPTCDEPVPLHKLEMVKGRDALRTTKLTEEIAARLRRQSEEDLKAVRAEGDRREAAARETAQREAAAAFDAKLLEHTRKSELAFSAQREELLEAREQHTELLGKLADAQAQFSSTVEQLRDQKSTEIAAIRAESEQREARAAEQARQSANAEHRLQLEAHTQQSDQALAALREQHSKTAHELTQANAQLVESRQLAAAADTRLQEQLTIQADQLSNGFQLQIAEMSDKLIQAQAGTEAKVAAATREGAERENGLRAEAEATREQLQQRQAELEQARESLTGMKTLHDAEIARVVQETRESVEKNGVQSLHAEQLKHQQEKHGLLTLIEDLKRKLEAKKNDELGLVPQRELYEELKATFTTDLIRNVPPGVKGADIIHEVRENEVVCGKIVYDRKNRQKWETEYATKLRGDQIAERASHAILSTTKFPKEAKGRMLWVVNGVILAHPDVVTVVAGCIRDHIIQLHTVRASNELREEKTHELYNFMTSDRFTQLLASVNTNLGVLEKIDETEMTVHRNTWERRSKVIRGISKSYADLKFEVHRIIGAQQAEDPSDSAG